MRFRFFFGTVCYLVLVQVFGLLFPVGGVWFFEWGCEFLELNVFEIFDCFVYYVLWMGGACEVDEVNFWCAEYDLSCC